MNDFTNHYEPLRPELYRYCRFLTSTPWDAEDLVQETLARALVYLADHEPAANPRAWLFRVASNRWINHVKRRREKLGPAPEPSEDAPTRATREAAGSLFDALPPQERAALVLKDVFELSLEEIAEVLETTVGAVKTALHRGRGRIVIGESRGDGSAHPAVLDAFCDAFNQRDIARLVELLLEDVEIEFPGTHRERGVAAARDALSAVLFGMDGDFCGGIAPPWRTGLRRAPPRLAVHHHRGEPLVVHYFQHDDGEAVRAFARVRCEGDRIAAITMYFHTPEVIAEVCHEAGLRFRTNGYRSA